MPPPSPDPCACGGVGYVVEAVGGLARARRCTCQDSCRRCGESGFVLVQAGDSMVAQPCACRHLDERVSLFNAIGIPAAHSHSSFVTFLPRPEGNQAAVKRDAEDFAVKFRGDRTTRGILLFGQPGCGKTHLLVSILRHLALEKGVSSRYIEFMLLLSDIRAGFSANRSHMEILRPLLGVPVLAIDELGKERGTEWERSMLDELISRRYNSGLTTLFATNYFLEHRVVREQAGRVVTSSPKFQQDAESMTLPQRVGDRIMSRLREMCELHKVEGPDGRRSAEPGRSLWRSGLGS
jgi:DNA replication protein DnaC